jgi:hypothetical protein
MRKLVVYELLSLDSVDERRERLDLALRPPPPGRCWPRGSATSFGW